MVKKYHTYIIVFLLFAALSYSRRGSICEQGVTVPITLSHNSGQGDLLKDNHVRGVWQFNLSEQKDTNTIMGPVEFGTWRSYYENGQLCIKVTFLNGKVHDTIEIYHNTGKLYAIGVFAEGELQDRWRYYTKGGKELDTPIESKDWEQKGLKEGNTVRKTGKWKYFYKNNQLLAEGQYMNNEKQGLWKFYSKQGSLCMQGFYTNSLKDSLWEKFYHDGSIKLQCYFSDGILSGEYKKYYRNGQLKQKGYYKKGLRPTKDTLLMLNWNSFTPVKKVVNRYRGVKDSTWNYYNTSGDLQKIELYSGGKLMSRRVISN
jgi:antitoxin component YwqK of YwqJK toxin-antitoxin module